MKKQEINSRELYCKPKNQTSIGGEALIEGVMMRGPENIAIAVRKNDGSIFVEKRPVTPLSKKNKAFKIPIIRGAAGIIDSMVIGIKSLMYSAEIVEIEEEENYKPSAVDKFFEKLFGDKLQDAMIYISVALAMVFGVAVFMVLPYFLAMIPGFDTATPHGLFLYNIFEGIIRIAIFFGYIILISKMKDIQRVFQYHGAEHKTIHCFENEEELTVENVRAHSTRHPRCRTAFLFVVMIVSILVFSVVNNENIIINVAFRLILVPLIAGISYEIIKFAGKSDLKIMRLVSMPGLALQRYTTREPDDSQIEVAIQALKNVLAGKKEICSDETASAGNNASCDEGHIPEEQKAADGQKYHDEQEEITA